MMLKDVTKEDITELVAGLNFAQKVERSLELIKQAYAEYGDGLVVANSLGKDSVAVWQLAKRVSPKIKGFIVRFIREMYLRIFPLRYDMIVTLRTHSP